MNLQGLILNKFPYQERHLVGSLLLRQGKKISLKFLGGRGGGKSQKGSILEPGAMIEFGLIGANKNNQRDLWLCKDWKSVWFHQRFRQDYRRFNLLCFYLELVAQIAPEVDLESLELEDTHNGLFSVLSNAIFYLEQEEELNPHRLRWHIYFFLHRLTRELGISPQNLECPFCSASLVTTQDLYLDFNQGAFICGECRQGQHDDSSDRSLYQVLQHLDVSDYKQVINCPEKNFFGPHKIWQYINHHYQFELKTWNTIKDLFF